MASPLLYLILMVVAIPVVTVSAVDCYQCNIFKQGTTHSCGGEERIMHNCSACYKTYVRAFLHNQWNRYTYTTAISRYCIRFGQLHKPEGCYVKTADSGYVRQCFCYSNLCNGAKSTRAGQLHTALTLTLALGTYLLFNRLQ